MFHYPANISALPIIANGGFFVTLFFVLSGFIIAGKYQNFLKCSDTRTYYAHTAEFLILRFGRLYPLHAFIIICIFVFNYISYGNPLENESITSLLITLLLLNGMGIIDGFGWNPPSWSVSTEFWAYLIFLLSLTIPFKNKTLGYFIVLAIGIGVLSQLDLSAPGPKYNLFYGCIAGFFTG